MHTTLPDTVQPRTSWLPLLLAITFCSLPALVPGQTIPTGGLTLVTVTDVATQGGFYSNTVSGGPVATRDIIGGITGQPFTQVARVNVQHPDGQFWSSAINSSSTRAVTTGDVVLVHFFMRAIQTTDETGAVYCQVYAEKNSDPYSKSLSQVVSAGPEWVEYFLPFRMTDSLAAGDFGLKFGFGGASRPQILELADARMIWYGTSRTLEEMPRTSFRYEGREPDAAWRADATRRIEQYRKGDYTVRVVNDAGLPVPGAQVRMKLRRHQFVFGCSWDSARIVNQTTTDNQLYRSKLLELFNGGSTANDLKWGPWIGEWGASWGQTQTMNALSWMNANSGFHLRGHVLVWPSLRNSPNFLQPLITAGDSRVPQYIIDHITDIVTKTKDYVPEWDVINEPYDNHDIMDKFGNALMPEWFKEAHRVHPAAKLYINDYAIISGGGLNVAKQDFYADTIQYLLDNAAPLHGVGFQGHFDAGPTGMAKAWSIMERYATEFPNLEFKITEFDVDTDDEQLQADYLRDFLTLVFSHPKFTGFQVWGFWESAHWKPRAAMVRANWQEKPNAAIWRSLVLNEWQTDERRTTATDGRVRGRGFLGDYDVTVTVGGQTFNATAVLSADGLTQEVTVTAPVDAAPQITLQPTGAIVAPGEAITLSFEASGNPAPTLTWYRNGTALGTSVASLAIPTATQADEGVYYAEASSVLGTARTRPVKVGVRLAHDRREKLVNISTRGRIMAGDAVMIAGFVVEGGSKDTLLRGIGPRLSSFGVAGVLPNPQLTLFRSSDGSVVATNKDWDPALAPVFAQVGAFDLTGGGLADDHLSAALRQTLPPGGYTVHLGDESGATGVGIVEAYDVATGEPLNLVNISTRGWAGSGEDLLIAGFVIQGEVPQRLLIRAIGPQLAAFGVSDTLADPRLTVLEGLPGGIWRNVTWNDDWCQSTDRSVIEAVTNTTGAFPLEPYSRDASLVIALEPGQYTVQVGGPAGTAGVALVEIYAIP